MATIEFIYEQVPTDIQVDLTDKFEVAVQRYKNKMNKNLENLVFLAKGKYLKGDEIVGNIIDHNSVKTKVLVYQWLNTINTIILGNKIGQKSKNIICPECQQPCKICIKDTKIRLYGCKYGHNIENIKIDEFENTQKIKLSSIICDECIVQNIGNTNNNEFYQCIDCNMKLCPYCKADHDPNHSIVNYDLNNPTFIIYMCPEHKKNYIKHCIDCKKDICSLCEQKHKSHHKKIPNINGIKNNINDLRNSLDQFKNNINDLVKKFNYIMRNMELFYKFCYDSYKSYEDEKNNNFNILFNLEAINNAIYEEIRNLKFNYSFGTNINKLLYLYSEMRNENKEIEMKYKIRKQDKQARIFGKNFIYNNIYKCKIVYNNTEYELTEYLRDTDIEYTNKTEIIFKLKGIQNVADMSCIFENCNLFTSLPDISKWDTSNIYCMGGLFHNCTEITSLPDISNWNLTNVGDISGMFSGCHKLKLLPDISKWDTGNIFWMSNLFRDCNQLLSLPDISNWNCLNNRNLHRMFSGCIHLLSIPDISKWDVSKVIDVSYLFYDCKELKSLPDISKWDVGNVIKFNHMFSNCEKLLSLPNISNWNTSSAITMNSMFSYCYNLIFPELNWDTSKVNDMNSMFENCSSLSKRPHKAGWDMTNVNDAKYMYESCNKIPDNNNYII